jgi:acyl carrier protein phosphodiesterase
VNFLAHALLAGPEPALIVGGVAGDWVKGPLPGTLAADLARGVALHRAIDSHAETDPAFCASRRRVSAQRRRYAGVLVDIFYDHLLAKDWASFCPISLAMFTENVYALVAARLDDLPDRARPALELMARENWLASYAGIDGIAAVLRRMARRARFPNPLAGAEEELLADLSGYAGDFRLWLAGAIEYADQWQSVH